MKKARSSLFVLFDLLAAGHFCAVVVCHLDVRAAAKDKQTLWAINSRLYFHLRDELLSAWPQSTVNAPGNVFSTHAPASV
jgi:hypothetical protein